MRGWVCIAWIISTLALPGCGKAPVLVEVVQVSCPPVWPSLNCPGKPPQVNNRPYEQVIYDLLELHQKCLAADRTKNKARAACP